LEGAKDGLIRHGVSEEDIDIARTPGCFEIPLIAQKLAQSGRYDAMICLGTIIRGDTPHFDYVASQVNRGIGKVALDTGLPVMQGIITADTLEQAIQRAGAKEGNRGFAAALSAIEMANLTKAIQ
jgi:6,7-dimethyl-8-ribityllumazine synthase